MTFQGKVALITGGGGGIGSAVAHVLGARGASIIVNYVNNAAAAEQVEASIRMRGGTAKAVRADIREAASCDALVKKAHTTFGRIDILVHCAAPRAILKPFAALNAEEFAHSVMGELTGVFEITKAVVPLMQQQQYGRIVYMGAGLARAPQPLFMGVGVAKAGIATFARYIAMEYGPDGITANVVEPGLVNTELSAPYVTEQERQIMAAITPLSRIAQPDDIAHAIAFLAGDDSSFVTGMTLPVNGGITMA